MRALIGCLIFFVAIVSWAQNPGGVAGSISWVKPLACQKGKGIDINNNLVDTYKATQKAVELSSEKSLLAGLTFFCVSLTDTLTERALWRIGTDSSTNVVMTNRRMAGLDEYKYINFQDKLSASPQISTYSRKRALVDTLNTRTVVRIGTVGEEKIPINDFKGALPEYILYDRVLSFHERMRVQSYLAIKYGISLKQAYPTSYLCAKGEVIWDAEKFAAFSGSITGIGRDDLSGLEQLKSSSSNAPKMLEVAVEELADQDFLIWGDNQQPLIFARKRGEITKLQRGWVAAASGDVSTKLSSLNFSTTWMQEMYPLAKDEIYWLAIDDSGTGTYPMGQSRYFANSSALKSNQQFDGIKWDLNGNGYDYFTLVAAPELFAKVDFVLPNCRNNQMGELKAELIGGVAPFQVKLMSGDVVIEQQKAGQRVVSFSRLLQGTYQLLVSDSQNRTYKQELLMANSDMEQVAKFEPIALKSGSSLMLDGTTRLGSPSNYLFNWQKPSGESVNSAYLSVNEGGVYVLSVTNCDGCSTLREAEVTMLPNEFLKYVEISPNPAVQKVATLKVQLVQEGTIKVSITSPNGLMVSSEEFSGNSYYSITCQFPQKGMWLVTVEGNGEKKTLKVLANFN